MSVGKNGGPKLVGVALLGYFGSVLYDMMDRLNGPDTPSERRCSIRAGISSWQETGAQVEAGDHEGGADLRCILGAHMDIAHQIDNVDASLFEGAYVLEYPPFAYFKNPGVKMCVAPEEVHELLGYRRKNFDLQVMVMVCEWPFAL
ncbi:hypothetical protein E2F48_11565 [Arthrobacter crusticola]|uniref:Uncharacterized protein n=1 Tax=Arthrobacter crusticola TaxID=2547960 RepID=A0A4R5TXG3_9MICC|nr:hypothetical protein [Arthrobacter crusticola]TDK25852.1 hypothetical protein E2F48_11565 [Arthrobacter crusticola]